MRVIRGISTDLSQPLTSPYLAKSGVYAEFRGGDYLRPDGKGDWFKPPYFASVTRRYHKYAILPFLSIRIGCWGFYIGAKAYGADSPAYMNWMEAFDVYPGSQALMWSARATTNLGE